MNSVGESVITFPVAFNSSPTPLAVAGDLTGVASAHVSVQIGGITTSGFFIRVSFGNAWAANKSQKWVALGY